MKKIHSAWMALACAAVSPLAQAQAAGDVLVRARVVNLDPANQDDIAITDVSINHKVIPEVDFSYFLTPNIAAELVLTYPQKQDVSSTAHRGKIGTLKHLPPVLSVQYHFSSLGTIKPYLGLGVNVTRFSSVDLPTGFSVDKRSVGLSLQAGVDLALSPQWSLNLDVKKVRIRTDLYASGANLGTIKIDPTLIGLGVGVKF